MEYQDIQHIERTIARVRGMLGYVSAKEAASRLVVEGIDPGTATLAVRAAQVLNYHSKESRCDA